MNDTEFEGWLASRLGDGPSPEPSPRLVALVHAGRRPGGALTRKPSLTMPGWFTAGRRASPVSWDCSLRRPGRRPAPRDLREDVPNVSASGRPSISPTGTPTASPRPSTSPTAAATATALAATVVARVTGCQNPLGWDYAVSGNDLFVVCDASNSPSSNTAPGGAYAARVDLTTNKVTATYRYKTIMTTSRT